MLGQTGGVEVPKPFLLFYVLYFLYNNHNVIINQTLY